MDDCIDSDGEVSTTKKKSDSNADNVPVSVSEEEEAQMEMESEDEEKDSKAASAPTIEGEVPCVSPPVDEEDNLNKEDNDNNDNDEEDDDNSEDYDDADEEDDNNNEEEDNNVVDEEDVCDFDLNNVKGMSEYEVLRLRRICRNKAKLASLGLLGGMTSAASPSADRTNRKKCVATQVDFVMRIQP